jgi:hypothetical protein
MGSPIFRFINYANVGANGPMLPGQTWHVTVRNWGSQLSNTCHGSHCNIIAGWQWPR